MSVRNYPSPRISDLRDLAERHGPVISLYVPVTAVVPNVTQNRVRHGRVVSEALEQWHELGATESDLQKAADDLERFSTESAAPDAPVESRAAFWSSDQGLRVFGLPFPCDERASVASSARIRPIASASARPTAYRVLTLSTNQVAVYEGDENQLRKIQTPGLPESLEDALGTELSEPSLHTHGTGRAGALPIYHGQGGAPRARQVDLAKFYQHVARGLEAALPADGLPLVLAADVHRRPGLEKALGGKLALHARQVEGNVDHMSLSDLHRASWSALVTSHSTTARHSTIARDSTTDPQENRGPSPVTQISKIVANATMGRIRRLRVPEEGRIPGRLNRSLARAEEAWGDDDLIDDLVVEVLRRGGAVEVMAGEAFPSIDGGLSALLR